MNTAPGRRPAAQQKISPKIFNSIINKTPLTARTNRIIGGRAASEYLARLANVAKVDQDVIGKYVKTHLADPRLMEADDFAGFMAARRAALLDRIGAAMGKSVVQASGPKDVAEPDDDTDDF